MSKRARQGKDKIRSLRKINEKLKAKFLPPHYLQDNYTKLHNLRQESKSVEEYTREFEKLLMICDLRENEDQTTVRILGGLNESIRNVMELQHYTTLDEVCSLAHKVELQKKAKLKKEPPKPPQRAYPFNKGNFFPTLLSPQTPPCLHPHPSQTHPSHPSTCLRREGVTSAKDLGTLLRIAQIGKSSPWLNTKHLRKSS